jgi:hypothetical protein
MCDRLILIGRITNHIKEDRGLIISGGHYIIVALYSNFGEIELL